MMTEQFLQEKLGELIYILWDKDFNCITERFYDKHINHCLPFNEKQIAEFKMFLNDFLADLNIQVKSGDYLPIVGLVADTPPPKLPPIIDVLNKSKSK